jgi:hypothetical protein
MTKNDSNVRGDVKTCSLSSAEFAFEPRTFVQQVAERMAINLDEMTLAHLSQRITQGESREQIIAHLRSFKGERQPADESAAALNFARLGERREALIVENIVAFAPRDNRAFVLYAYLQVLDRHPENVELARLMHQLDTKTINRLDLLETLDRKSVQEGRPIIWDTRQVFPSVKDAGRGSDLDRLVETPSYRSISQSSSESHTLCRYADGKWELAPSMVSRIEEIGSDSWTVSEGFILTGPKRHLSPGQWLVELDIVQPEWAAVHVDVVANLAVDRLLDLTAYGSLRGSFVFEKLSTHAFVEVRLQVHAPPSGQWISIQSIRLRKID